MEKEKMEQKEVRSCCCCSGGETSGEERHKVRDEKERANLMRRLAIIEGQIRGIRGMLEKDIYCIDILTQVSAANCALNSFSKALLAQHIRGCVAEDIRDGHEEKLEELVKVLPKLMK